MFFILTGSPGIQGRIMSQDVEGPQCEAQDSDTKVRCTSTKTRLYFIAGKPVGLQKRRFCQPHGVMLCPSGGGGIDAKGKHYPAVKWEDSDEVIEKVPGQAALTRRPRDKQGPIVETPAKAES